MTKKLLIDLKPALDGYSGIPQETRLLFSSLKRLGTGVEVEGLIQHGSGVLSSNGADNGGVLAPNEKIFRDARLVSSLCRSAVRTIVPGLPRKFQRKLDLLALRWQAFRDREVGLGTFESDLFDDFVWRHLFAKSVNVVDKDHVSRSRFRVVSPSRRNLHEVGLASFARFAGPRYLRLDTRGYDYLLVQTPFPARVAPETRIVVRYHDAVPILMPHTISDRDFHMAAHHRALRQNVRDGAIFACISEATRSDLVTLFPEAADRSSVIYNMVSDDYFPCDEPASRAFDIISNRLDEEHDDHGGRAMLGRAVEAHGASGGRYLLMVSTIEPRKNHQLLISAWERLRYTTGTDLKLVLVGGNGWEHEKIAASMHPWMQRGHLLRLSRVPSPELRVLYRHAAVTVCPSLAEGFDYSGIEAMRSGGLVVASDIGVHREVFGDGAAFFDAYAPEDAADAIGRLLTDEASEERERLRAKGGAVAARYLPANILPKWRELFRVDPTGSA
jgi:glycosyltransferase involved in cell wall biosynthesis